jgi:hypothetical protein
LAEIPVMANELVTAPPVLSTLIAHPLEPPLGAVMAQGPITYGLAGVPFPAVTQAHPVGEPGGVKSEFAVMVIAACCPLPALAAAGMLTPTAKATTVRKTKLGCPELSGRGSNRIFTGKDGIEWQERNAVISLRSSRRKPPGWW